MGVHAETVQKLYIAYFGRPADPPGLGYWENAITRANGSTAAVAAEFAKSSEYKKMFEGLDEAGIVDLIYHNLFGRGAEPGGAAYWTAGLKENRFTIDQVVTIIAQSATGSDKAVFDNKVTAATAFTVALDTIMEIIAYSGTSANGILQKWLAGVTTAESLHQALARVDAVLNDIMSPHKPMPMGLFETVSLATLPALFDADNLVSRNQAIEFVAEDLSGDRRLVDLAPSSHVVLKGGIGDSVISLAQKSPGALKLIVDDESPSAADAPSFIANVVAENASTLNVYFATPAADKGRVSLNLTGTASSLNVEAGGYNATNVLAYKDAGKGALTSITITGENALVLSTKDASGLKLIDASKQLHGLSVAVSALANGGTLRLGGGTDYVTVDDEPGALNIAATRAIEFFERSTDDVPTGDFLLFGPGARVADAHPGFAGGGIRNGVLTFTGTRPDSLEAAVTMAGRAADSAGETVLFAYQGDSYVFIQGWGVEDRVVKLVGVTGASMLWQPGDAGDGSFVIV